jgi:ABC-type nitrate/sulfonate/bicarbonate transport system substrate-binding protein
MATLALACAVQPAFAAEPVTLRVGTPFSAVPGIKAAIEEGYFKREGIDVQLVVLSGGPNILAATVGGSVDIGYADMFAWIGSTENGFSLRLVQGANGRGQSDYLIVGPRSGVASPQDLVGKKIGVAAHAQSRLRVALYLKRFGVDPSQVQTVVINQRDTVGAALASGQIQAAIASDPDVAQWQHQFGVIPLTGRPWQQIPEHATTAGFFATPAFVSAHADLVDRFARIARAGAVRYNHYSAEQKARIALKYDHIDLFALEKQTPGILKRMDDTDSAQEGPINLADTNAWLDIARANGVIKGRFDLKPLIDSTALRP